MNYTDQKQDIKLTDLFQSSKQNIFANLNCVNIGVIQSFDATKQTAKIQLSIKRIIDIKPDGTKVLQDRPVLAQVPVVVLGGMHNVRVPILQGDIALVLFNDRDIDNWFVANSGLPNTLRMHDVSDAIAITGLHNISNTITDYLNDRVTLYWDAASRVEVLSSLVNIITTLCKVTGKLEVTGDTKLDSKLEVVDSAKLDSTLDVTGKITCSATVEGASLKADDGKTTIIPLTAFPTSMTFKDGILVGLIP